MAAASYGVATIRTFVLERMQTDYAKVSLPAVCLRAVQGEAYVFLQGSFALSRTLGLPCD
jgi:hypothetical protein